MREIKFRAWDSKYKRWSYPTSRLIHDDHIFILYGLEDYIHVMQYTGLKDKNGVEIFEGDIVQYHGYIFPIVFDKGAFCGSTTSARTFDKSQKYAHLSGYSTQNLEVIGNIYENPELLK